MEPLDSSTRTCTHARLDNQLDAHLKVMWEATAATTIDTNSLAHCVAFNTLHCALMSLTNNPEKERQIWQINIRQILLKNKILANVLY